MNVGLDEAVDAAVVSAAGKATITGAVTGAVGWIASVNWLGLVGAAVAILGLVVNVYFQIRRDRRESRESAMRIEALRERMKS